MRRPRVTGDPIAVLAEHTNRLARKFEYPDIDTIASVSGGGGGGMVHVVICSTSEPQEIQDKADYVVSERSTAELDDAFRSISRRQGNQGQWSVWMVGNFRVDYEVRTPFRALIRGVGWTLEGGLET